MSAIAHDFGECRSPCPYCAAEAAWPEVEVRGRCVICGDYDLGQSYHSDDAPPLPAKPPIWEPPQHPFLALRVAESEDPR